MCGAALAGASAGAGFRPNDGESQKILRRTDFLQAARENQRNTTRLLLILHGIAAVLGYLLGWNFQLFSGALPEGVEGIWFFSSWGVRGALIVVAVSALWSWIAMKQGDRIVLRIAGAREVSAEAEPMLHNVVEEMAIAAGVTKPAVYVMETDALNAFATGMNVRRSAIGVTRGLLQTLTREELQGVVGHEMSHIVNLDIRYATAVGVLVGVIALVSDAALRMLRFSGGRGATSGHSGGGGSKGGGASAFAFFILVFFAAVAPLVARLVQMAVSRQREFLADATSVRLTRNPLGLISALEKLDAHARPFPGANRATQHMFIVNPFRHFSDGNSALMSTHPPLLRRILRLRNLGAD